MAEVTSDNKPGDIWNESSDLLKQRKIDKLLTLGKNREKTYPDDPAVYWCRAKVHYLNKEWEQPLKNIGTVGMLAPSWKAEFTNPLKENIREMSR